MNIILLDLLACPLCHGNLELRIVDGSMEYITSGYFYCYNCSRKFIIEEDIPIFSPIVQHRGIKNQQETYSTWWNDYHDEKSIINPEYHSFFYNSLKIKAGEMEGKILLDAGCGNGRFSFVVSHYNPKLLVSFDISSGIVHARRAITKYNPNANVAYVQGDITSPPFKKAVFDIVFSWGVIHHTPNTTKTFSTISKLVKDGGRLGVYVYEFHPLYKFNNQPLSFIAYLRSLFLVRPLRFICSRLPAKLVRLIFIPVYYIERLLGIGVVGCHGPAEDKWNKERYLRVVIDRFKTRYASEHQLEEVISWFRDNSFNQLRVGWKPRISISGTKETLGGFVPLSLSLFNEKESDESRSKFL